MLPIKACMAKENQMLFRINVFQNKFVSVTLFSCLACPVHWWGLALGSRREGSGAVGIHGCLEEGWACWASCLPVAAQHRSVVRGARVPSPCCWKGAMSTEVVSSGHWCCAICCWLPLAGGPRCPTPPKMLSACKCSSHQQQLLYEGL